MKTVNVVIAIRDKELGDRKKLVFDPLCQEFHGLDVKVHLISNVDGVFPRRNDKDFAHSLEFTRRVISGLGDECSFNKLVSAFPNPCVGVDDWVVFIDANTTHLHMKWADTFRDYVDQYGDSCDVLAGLCIKLKNVDGGLVMDRFTNDAAWSAQVVEEVGLYDMNIMLRTNVFEIQHAFIKGNVISEVGAFKSDIKKMYDYEYALRVLNAGFVVRAIPKLVFYQLNETYVDGEVNFYGSIARKEFFFLPEDGRNIGELYGTFNSETK